MSRWTLLALLGCAACRDPASLSGTALLITTDSSEVVVDQLVYEVALEGRAVLEPTRRPVTPGAALPSMTVVRVLLADALAGQTPEVTVTGLLAGATVGVGRGTVAVARGVERALTVRLSPPAMTCAGCRASSGACVSPVSTGACGANGEACVACDLRLADQCSATGQCACGAGAPCSLGLGADHCEAGQCRCGLGPSCTAGQECLAQTCQCTPASCAGCCVGATCITTPSPAACGTGGRACLDCGGTPCTAGQCAMTACNPTTCPTGCCVGATCVVEPTAQACGTGGRACESCGLGSCDGGTCEGTCNAQACPTGCCRAGVCLPGTEAQACGGGGATCETCMGDCTGQRCATPCGPAGCPDGCCQAGVCAPGSSAGACGRSGGACVACGAGTSCDGGQCVTSAVCNATNCPLGCCDGSTCRSRSTATCGLQGAACVACAGAAVDRCSATGLCGCGTGPACEAGHVCVMGNCVCDPASCAGCCNGGRCLPGTFKQDCGSDGGACVRCPGALQCVAQRCQ